MADHDDSLSVSSSGSAVEQVVAKKARITNGYFKWTVETEEFLARQVNKLKVHLKKNGTGLAKGDQWKLVLTRLKESNKTDAFMTLSNDFGHKSLRSNFLA